MFHGDRGRRTVAVDGVDLSLARGCTLGLVGEFGLRQERDVARRDGPAAEGERGSDRRGDLRRHRPCSICRTATLRDLRGNRMAMIFQEPMTSLNPSYTIGEQIVEVLVRHRGLTERAGARARRSRCCAAPAFPSPEQRIDDYPHKLSGGMRQRAMIAIALACDPELLIADEPTTALDVTIQAQILDLMRELKRTSDAAIILITHDLGVVAEVCDEVAVMYAGEIVERAPADALFEAPEHPYTVGLLASIPRLDLRSDRLAAIEGVLPDMTIAAGRLPFRRPLSVRAGTVPRRAAAGGRAWRALVALPARAAGEAGAA